MLSQILGNVIFIFLLVFANGFFVAAEFAIVKVRVTQIELKIKRGHRGAKLAKHIVEHLDAYLSATQLGITFTSIGLGWVGEPLLADMLAGPLASLGVMSQDTIHVICFLFSFGILTFLLITLGELGPRYLAIQYPDTTALLVSFPLQLFYRIFKPFIWLLNRSSNVLLQFVGITPTTGGTLVHSPEELEMLVTEGARQGGLNKTEQELIASIFEFSTTTAKEIMVPRTDVVAIEYNTPREAVIRVVTEEGYSRLPVYKNSLDNIVGIIYTKDLISLLEHRDLILLQDIVRPAYFIPGALKISQLMKDLQEMKIHMAIVVDEFGGTEGIVTMEDILEEIVGEIHDEYDEVLKDIEQSADGSTLVNARMHINDFNERFAQKFGVEIPEDPEYETINGFLSKITGRIPELHEEIPFATLHFTVVKKSQRRIRQVKVLKAAGGLPENPTTSVPNGE
jgi:CBS domain containing-hemolysin-like protein